MASQGVVLLLFALSVLFVSCDARPVSNETEIEDTSEKEEERKNVFLEANVVAFHPNMTRKEREEAMFCIIKRAFPCVRAEIIHKHIAELIEPVERNREYAKKRLPEDLAEMLLEMHYQHVSRDEYKKATLEEQKKMTRQLLESVRDMLVLREKEEASTQKSQ